MVFMGQNREEEGEEEEEEEEGEGGGEEDGVDGDFGNCLTTLYGTVYLHKCLVSGMSYKVSYSKHYGLFPQVSLPQL